MNRFKMMALIVFGLAGSQHCVSTLGQQPKLELPQKAVASLEIEKYLANRTILGDYRCAIAVEELREESKDPADSLLVNFNMIRCRRIADKLIRQDVYEPIATIWSGITSQSLVLSDKALHRKMSDNSVQKIEFAKAKEDDWKPLTDLMLYDPLFFPLKSGDSIRGYSVIGRPVDQLEQNLAHFREVDRKQTLDATVVGYRVSEKYPVFSEVRYATKQGGMPVEVLFYELRGSDKKKLGITNTQWEQKANRWFPVRIDSVRFTGPITVSTTCHCYWKFGPIDPSIFDLEDGKGLSSQQLWASIVEF